MRAKHGPAVSLVLLFTSMVFAGCSGGGGGGGSSGKPNSVPLANAGTDQTVKRSATVALDGSASNDSDGDALAYRWEQIAGEPVTLSSTTSAKPTFTAPPKSGSLSFALITNDGKASSATDTVSVVVENHAPTASSISTVAAGPGTKAMLDGSASSDADGDPLTYQWTQLSGPTVTVDAVAPGVAQFQVPNTPVTLIFALTVSDGEAISVTINVTVNVVIAAPSNHAPEAGAWPDYLVPRRSQVILYGWASDPDTGSSLTYSWEQIEGPTVTLSNSDTPYPSFTAPETPAKLKFALRASDGTLTSTAAITTVTVKNFSPIVYGAWITPNVAYTTNDLTVGAQIADADNDSIARSYEWRRNGVLVSSQTASSFPASLTTKNDVITARMTVSDGFVEVTADASTVILDSAAVLSTSQPPPTALDYGDTASFTVSATDADGDAANGFEVAFGPAGFAVTPQGAVTWTAAGPMFDKVADFNWGVRVAGDEASLLSGTFTVTDSARQYPVRRTGVEIPVQQSGLQIGDFDGDGSGEILVGSSQSVYVLNKSGSTYQQSWVYPFEVVGEGAYDYNTALSAVAAKDVDGDGKQEIFFSKNNVLVRLDGVKRRETARHSQRCRTLELADLDGDGALELVCLAPLPGSYSYGAGGRIVVLNATTLAEKWSTPELQLGYNLAVGNVDNDAALEIVTSGGYVFDGLTQQNQWVYSQAFGGAVDTGDLDGDGIEEIVGMSDWSAVRAFSAVSKSPLWEYLPTWQDLDSLVVADADGDGKVEAIVGNGQWGNVMAIGYDTATHAPALLWEINSQNHGVTSIAVGDVDGDGIRDVVWGGGASSSGRDDLVVAGFTPLLAVKWKSSSEPQLDGGFYGGALARIGGGASRLMFGSPQTNSGYSGMRAIAIDPATGHIETSDEIGTNWASAHAFDVADYDQDNIDELFIGTANLYNAYFAVYDFAARSVDWQSSQSYSENGVAVTHADMNGDGYADLIGLTANAYVYVYDVHAQSLIWKSTGLGNAGVDVAVADLDHDGKQEIIVALGDRLVIYRKAVMGYLEIASVATTTKDLAVGDLDGSGAPKIYTLDGSNWTGAPALKVFDAQLQPVRTVPLGMGADSIYIEESAFSRKNLLVATTITYSLGDPVEIWALDPANGAEIWHSPPLAGSVRPNSLQFVDVDGDGHKEISFATSLGMNYTR